MKFAIMWGKGMLCDAVFTDIAKANQRFAEIKSTNPITELWIETVEDDEYLSMREFDDKFEDFLQDDFT